MIPCNEQGPSAWCYMLRDGSHVDSEQCRCFQRKSPNRPAHR